MIYEPINQTRPLRIFVASGGDDGPVMPKLRKEGHQNYPSHPPTPQSTAVPSPGAVSMGSMHEDYEGMNSPTGWQARTPTSPVCT